MSALLNCRTLTTSELLNLTQTLRNEKSIRYYNAVQAAFELADRLALGSLIEEDIAQAKLDNETEIAYEHGHHDGKREEREDILDFLTDFLNFNMKEKIESDVIDHLIGRMRRHFPEIEVKHYKDFKAAEESQMR